MIHKNLLPGGFPPGSLKKNTFCEYAKIRTLKNNRWVEREFIIGYHNIDYLHGLIGFYVYDCELEINSKKLYIDVYYNIEPSLYRKYIQIRDKYLSDEKMELYSNNIFLSMVQQMQHSYCLAEEKFRQLECIIERVGKRRVIIFCKFIKSVHEIQSRFPGVRVLTYQKHALGLNLQEYNHTVFFDKKWDYACILQAEQRTYRTGQKEDCYYYNFTGRIKLEELISRNNNKKITMLDYFKNRTANDIQ